MEIQTQLPKVGVGRRCGAMQANLGGYRSLLSEAMDEELTTLAKNLKGIRICHVNSTAAGGGVAELLARYIPMLQALGVQADWRLIHGEPDFFAITKAFHNALQGGRYGLGKAEQDRYLKVNERSAKALGNDYDLYIVHDPQPAAIRHFAGSRGAKWMWRCHIDSSTPDKDSAICCVPSWKSTRRSCSRWTNSCCRNWRPSASRRHRSAGDQEHGVAGRSVPPRHCGFRCGSGQAVASASLSL
ncbi:MAG: hypothetical protein JSR20_02530 [Nitrospira sp.]|nr:hypothetical protein [Nitrospira sp.]